MRADNTHMAAFLIGIIVGIGMATFFFSTFAGICIIAIGLGIGCGLYDEFKEAVNRLRTVPRRNP